MKIFVNQQEIKISVSEQNLKIPIVERNLKVLIQGLIPCLKTPIVEQNFKVLIQGLIPYSISENVIVEKVAGETIGSHKIVKLGDNGYLYYASCNVLDDVNKILGLSLNSANVGENVRVLIFGKLSDSSFNFNIDKPIFLGINGQIVQEVPETAVFIQRLGKVLRNNEIMIDLDEPIIL